VCVCTSNYVCVCVLQIVSVCVYFKLCVCMCVQITGGSALGTQKKVLQSYGPMTLCSKQTRPLTFFFNVHTPSTLRHTLSVLVHTQFVLIFFEKVNKICPPTSHLSSAPFCLHVYCVFIIYVYVYVYLSIYICTNILKYIFKYICTKNGCADR
jgi:hypothetical protein